MQVISKTVLPRFGSKRILIDEGVAISAILFGLRLFYLFTFSNVCVVGWGGDILIALLWGDRIAPLFGEKIFFPQRVKEKK